MLHFDREQIQSLFSYEEFIPFLKEYFTKEISSPQRPHYPIANDTGDPDTLLLMPAWQVDEYIGVKLVTVFKENAQKGLNTINGLYILFDGKTGIPLCTYDAASITTKRTAATSALASSFLARPDSQTYTILGTGNLCLEMIRAHQAVLPIQKAFIWGRDLDKAKTKSEQLNDKKIDVTATTDKAMALLESDVVSAATFSKVPIVLGKHINPGTHIDLVGSYLPDYREADDELVSKSSIFIDTEAAIKESGDLIIPISNGVINRSAIQGTLIELCDGSDPGRIGAEEITYFKSVGYALEDLAIAIYLYQKNADHVV